MKNRSFAQLSAGAVLLVAALTACGGGGGTAPGGSTTAPPSTTSPAPSSQTSAPSSPSATAAPATDGKTTAPPPAADPADPASDTDCKAGELSLALKDGDAGAGTVHRNLVFTNKGSRTCTMQGFPGVSYVAGDDGHQVGPAAYRQGTKGAKVTLKPGGTATAPVGFVQVRNYEERVCKPTQVRGLRVYPPHDTASMFVPMDGLGCAGTPPGNQLTVQTVV